MVRIPWRRKAPRSAQQQDSQPDLESWADRDGKIEVSQPKGFFTKVSLRARVDLPPDDVYEILIDPDNSAVFKGIKEVKYRKVLKDDKKGRQKVEVEQLAAWKFLMFSGSFATRLYVFQDKQQRTVEFKLARPGLMKDFAGKWTVQPFTQNTLDGIYSKAEQPSSAAPWHSLTSSLTRRLGDSKAEASLVTLEQSLEPNFRPPKPFDGLVKGIAAQQLKNILDQLRGEVPKIKAGKPSLPSWRVRNGSAPQVLLAGTGRRHDTEQTASHNSRHSGGGSLTGREAYGPAGASCLHWGQCSHTARGTEGASRGDALPSCGAAWAQLGRVAHKQSLGRDCREQEAEEAGHVV